MCQSLLIILNLVRDRASSGFKKSDISIEVGTDKWVGWGGGGVWVVGDAGGERGGVEGGGGTERCGVVRVVIWVSGRQWYATKSCVGGDG